MTRAGQTPAGYAAAEEERTLAEAQGAPTEAHAADTRPGPPAALVAVARFTSHAEAERAVDRLVDRGFPVEGSAIVARDLRFVEAVTESRGLWGAAVGGLVSGALVGLLWGWLAGLFNWVQPLETAVTLGLYGLVLGGLIGLLVALLAQALTRRGGRGFSSAGAGFIAGAYEVMVDHNGGDEARGILAGGDAAGDTPGR